MQKQLQDIVVVVELVANICRGAVALLVDIRFLL